MEVNSNAKVHTIVPLRIGSVVNPSWPTGFGIFKTVSFVDSRVSIYAGAGPALSKASMFEKKWHTEQPNRFEESREDFIQLVVIFKSLISCVG